MSSSSNNQNQTSMPYQAIIVLCLLGAGAALLCAWALFRHCYEPEVPITADRETSVGDDGLTQAQYMRTVRLKNHEDLQRMYGYMNGYARPKLVGQSTVSSY